MQSIFSQLRRWPSLLVLTALTALSSTAIALAADLNTDAVLGSSASTPTTVNVGSNGFDIKIWATGNLSDGKPGTASVVKTYNMATNGTITPDATSPEALTFETGTHYSNNGCNTATPSILAASCPSGSFANPKIVQATLIVAAGTPAAMATGLRPRLRFRLDRAVGRDDVAALARAIGVVVRPTGDVGWLEVAERDPSPELVAAVAAACRAGGLLIVESRTVGGTLEEAYLELVGRDMSA